MLSLEHVSKVYETRNGHHHVLKDVSFTLGRGRHMGVLGRNGAGKSTMIRLISGAERPTSGRIRRGMRVSWPLAFIGGFQAHMTGLDNLKFICRIYGANYKALLPFIEDFTELGKFMREPVMHYSNGMATRLAFALSMAIEFDCFLIDEAMVVGDVRFHQRCEYELFQKRKDRAFVLVTHDASAIKRYCDDVSVLNEGHLLPFDTVDGAFAFYQTTVATAPPPPVLVVASVAAAVVPPAAPAAPAAGVVVATPEGPAAAAAGAAAADPVAPPTPTPPPT
jgi:capsular polysaccharide transport system ATP-binding protein